MLVHRIRNAAIAMLLAAATWTSTAMAQSVPGEGPGGPILVVVDPADQTGHYYAEILRAEGLNEFAVMDVGDLSASTLAGYQAVVLAEAGLTVTQASVLNTWVQAGGNLIAMRPGAELAGLLGLGADGGDLGNGYVKIDTTAAPGAGITGDTMQFHGTADRWSSTTARTVATLYSPAGASASAPAVTLRSVGSAGGQAAAFTYDLASSVIATRQGNIAWAGQKRDGESGPIRSDDLFFPDWLDFDKVRIPQADEQQRLLVNLITEMTLDRLPLPRFWYLPRGLKAAVIMSGDDHAVGGTAGQFENFKAESPVGCSTADWECIRSTSYVYPGTPLSAAQASAYQAAGFEIALHLDTGCANSTPASLATEWAEQLSEFASAWPTLRPPQTSRTHCVAWSDWAGAPKAELLHGVRLDTNYYYWPGSWLQDRPGMFTGSGMPMRFADEDGSPIDVYQAATQMTDESDIDIAQHISTLLDGALGADGYYGVFTANMHTDQAGHPGAAAIVAAAKARGVPVVSAVQMLDWLDGRDGSSFEDLSFAAGRLRFTVAPAAGARGLQAMVPARASGGDLAALTRNGSAAAVTRVTVKGVEYAVFDAASGAYTATYGPADGTPPDTTIVGVATDADSARFTFSANENGAHFECRLDAAAYAACTSPAEFGGLANGSHTFSVRAIDAVGNVDPTPASRVFTTSGGVPPTPTGSAPGGGGLGEGSSSPDRSAPRVRIIQRRLRVSRTGRVTLRVKCPAGERRCRLDVQLRRRGHRLAARKITVAGGDTGRIVLRLPRAARERLARGGTLRVVAQVTVSDVALNRRTTRTSIRLLAPGRR